MNLPAAIQSGKPFRRKGWAYYWDTETLGDSPMFTIPEVLAEDWEIDEEKRELTWTDIHKALEKYATISRPGHKMIKAGLGFTE